MEPANHWSSQSGRSPGSSKRANATNRRNADRERELQRLKSLGVVSVLNKTFDSQDNMLAPAPIPSPSSSTSSATLLAERTLPKPTLSTSSSSRTSTQLQCQDDDKISVMTMKQQPRHPTESRYGSLSYSQPGGEQQWVVTILPAEQGEPRLDLDENRNPTAMTMSARAALENSNGTPGTISCGVICENGDKQLYHIDNHPSLVDHHMQTTQLLQQTRQQLASCQSQQKQMERDTKLTLEQCLSQKEMESVKVQQLSKVILKQDLVIHELETTLISVLTDKQQSHQSNTDNDNGSIDQHDGGNENPDIGNVMTDTTLNMETVQELTALKQELADLQVHKTAYEQMIVTLCSELESSQDETRKLTLLTTALNQQCQQQQEQIDGKISNLIQQLADKDTLIHKYRDGYYSEMTGNYRQDLQQQQQQQHQQQQQQQRHSVFGNDGVTAYSATSTSSSAVSMAFSEHDRYLARYSSASSYSRSSLRANSNTLRHSRNSLPRRQGRTGANVLSWPSGYIPPPSGPPPSVPLPPLPIVDDDRVDPELKLMTNMAPHSDDDDEEDADDKLEQEQQALTSSLEQLLLQAPSGYTLDDDTALNETYREFTEQLQSRLSMPKDLDHLKLWDHEALERLRQQQMAAARRRPSYAPTTNTAHTAASFSSQYSAASSSLLGANGDLDDQRHLEDQPHSRDHSAFWKGMKKKLHV